MVAASTLQTAPVKEGEVLAAKYRIENVIGVGGMTENGVSTSQIEEATMMASMIAAARRTIVIADKTKFGRLGFAGVAPLDQIDVLVTDEEPPSELKVALEAAGVRIVVAS